MYWIPFTKKGQPRPFFKINYYILSKYLEGVTTPGENILVSGMMARDESIYELIRDSRVEKYVSGVKCRETYV